MSGNRLEKLLHKMERVVDELYVHLEIAEEDETSLDKCVKECKAELEDFLSFRTLEEDKPVGDLTVAELRKIIRDEVQRNRISADYLDTRVSTLLEYSPSMPRTDIIYGKEGAINE